MCVYMQVCKCVCVSLCVSVCIYMNVSVYVWAQACEHAHVYVHWLLDVL